MDGLKENIFFHVRGKKKKQSSIKCQIKTEGGCLRKAKQPAVEGAPASRCESASEFMQTNDRVKDGRGW